MGIIINHYKDPGTLNNQDSMESKGPRLFFPGSPRFVLILVFLRIRSSFRKDLGNLEMFRGFATPFSCGFLLAGFCGKIAGLNPGFANLKRIIPMDQLSLLGRHFGKC